MDNNIIPKTEINNHAPTPNTALIIALVVLTLLTTSLLAYLIFQNNQLKKEISQLRSEQVQPETDQVISPQELLPQPTESVSETKNWHIYENENYNFRIKYPASWKIADYEKSLRSVYIDPESVLPEEQLKSVDMPGGLITIYFYENTRDLIGYDNLKSVTLDSGINAKLDEIKPTHPRPNPAYKNKHELHYLIGNHIKISYVGDSSDTYLTDFNQILSTFKFLQ